MKKHINKLIKFYNDREFSDKEKINLLRITNFICEMYVEKRFGDKATNECFCDVIQFSVESLACFNDEIVEKIISKDINLYD